VSSIVIVLLNLILFASTVCVNVQMIFFLIIENSIHVGVYQRGHVHEQGWWLHKEWELPWAGGVVYSTYGGGGEHCLPPQISLPCDFTNTSQNTAVE
jgi:hypothetical protein